MIITKPPVVSHKSIIKSADLGKAAHKHVAKAKEEIIGKTKK